MKAKNLEYYIYAFQNIRRDRKNGGSPHKPILLLSLIENFEQGIIQGNKIYMTPEFVASFKSNWQAYVSTNHDMRVTLPFYHLKSENFWELIPNKGFEEMIKQKSLMRSFKNLRTVVSYAYIDDELVYLLKDKVNRHVLKLAIIEIFFPNALKDTRPKRNILDQLFNSIVNEKAENYQSTLKSIKKKLSSERFEEEMYMRNAVFKKALKLIYNNTCCISGLRIDTNESISMIDGCHIVPFSISHDDTIGNGLVLCPNLHRAFDRGLISIDNDYKVVVGNNFKENDSKYSIKQFNGTKLLLPEKEEFFPKQINLEWHRSNIKD